MATVPNTLLLVVTDPHGRYEYPLSGQWSDLESDWTTVVEAIAINHADSPDEAAEGELVASGLLVGNTPLNRYVAFAGGSAYLKRSAV